MTTLTDFDARPASPWDLISFSFTAEGCGTLTRADMAGGDVVSGSRTTLSVAFASLAADLGVLSLTDDSGKVEVLNLNFVGTPYNATQHLVHMDGRGVTICDAHGNPVTTYRVSENAPITYLSAARCYADDASTVSALAERLSELGHPASLFDLDHGNYVAQVKHPTDPTTCYMVMASMEGATDSDNDWIVAVGKDEGDGFFEHQQGSTFHTGAPLDTPVDKIALSVSNHLNGLHASQE